MGLRAMTGLYLAHRRDNANLIRAVVVYRHDGLGCRLMSLGNGLRIARRLGVQCYMAWNERDRIGGIGNLGILLDVPAMAPEVIVLTLAQALRELSPAHIAYDRHKSVVRGESLTDADVFLCGYPELQRFDDEVDSPELRNSLADALRLLAPAPALAKRIRDFTSQHDLAAAVGVHVRRGDIVTNERYRGRIIELDRYFAVLDAVAPDEPLFLCTEDQPVVEAFLARYPGRVMRYATRSWKRGERAAAEDALIEMMLLSGTRYIIGGQSAFSRFAAARNLIPFALMENRHGLDKSIEIATAATRAGPALALSP